MKKKKRALRRHHSRRMEQRARNKFRYSSHFYWDNEERFEHFVRTHANNMQICSCPSCGNPRKHFSQLTIQEKKHELSIKEQINEYFNENSGQ